MYAYIIENKVTKYPYSFSQLKDDNKDTSFPAEMSDERLVEWNVYSVKPTTTPEVDHTKNVTEGTPIRQKARNADGTFKADNPETPENEAWEWVQVWNVTDASADEIAQREANKIEQTKQNRANAYREESDPLFFKWQRGESTEQEWLDKVAKIKARYPKD